MTPSPNITGENGAPHNGEQDARTTAHGGVSATSSIREQSERFAASRLNEEPHQLSLRKALRGETDREDQRMPFTVSYDGSDSDSDSDSGTVPCDPHGPYNPGETVLIPTVMSMSLSKTGAAFAYWNTKPDGSGAVHGWPVDTSFPMPASDVVLYAEWFVTTGLSAGGLTAHCTFAYDAALQADGLEPGRTQALMNEAEADFGIMSRWFAGVTPSGPSPIPVYVTRLNDGANNTGSIRLKPNTTDIDELRSYLVSEITESSMAGQNKGWGFLPGTTGVSPRDPPNAARSRPLPCSGSGFMSCNDKRSPLCPSRPPSGAGDRPAEADGKCRVRYT